MKKQGIVVERKGSKVVIFTNAGEFAIIRASSVLPIKGDLYEGNVINDNTIIKRVAVLAASFLMIFILGMVDYYNPVKAVELNVKSKIIIKANRWNKVIGVTTYDKKLKEIISKVNIENMSLNNAVKEISSEARKENIIESYSDISVQAVQGNVDMNSVVSQIDDLNMDEKNSLENHKNSNSNIKPDNGKEQQKNNNDVKANPNNTNDKDNTPVKKGGDSIKQKNNSGSGIDSTYKGDMDKSNDKVKGLIITEPADDGSDKTNNKQNPTNSNLNDEEGNKSKEERNDNNKSKSKENFDKR